MSTNANQNLSLGKLKRAVSSSIDDYTTESSMLAIAGGGSDVKFSDFSISSVDGLTGFTYLWEQTSEDYLCSFSVRTSERFDIKIAKVPGNFTWGINASGATITNNGATGSVAAAAISNANTGTGDDSDFFPAGTNNLNRTLSVTFKLPVVSFVDTAGAFPGKDAEERGQGEAIARNIYEMMNVKVPIINIIIGEGASGGALGIGVGDKILMLENTWYSVICPES